MTSRMDHEHAFSEEDWEQILKCINTLEDLDVITDGMNEDKATKQRRGELLRQNHESFINSCYDKNRMVDWARKEGQLENAAFIQRLIQFEKGEISQPNSDNAFSQEEWKNKLATIRSVQELERFISSTGFNKDKLVIQRRQELLNENKIFPSQSQSPSTSSTGSKEDFIKSFKDREALMSWALNEGEVNNVHVVSRLVEIESGMATDPLNHAGYTDSDWLDIIHGMKSVEELDQYLSSQGVSEDDVVKAKRRELIDTGRIVSNKKVRHILIKIRMLH